MAKNRKIKEKLVHTHEHIDDIYEQYYDYQNDYSIVQERILYIVNQLPLFEQDVFYLYAEYNSLRKVADEAGISYVSVKKILDKIRQDVRECKINDFSQKYIIKERGVNYEHN